MRDDRSDVVNHPRVDASTNRSAKLDCRGCGERAPARAVPRTLHEIVWGGWTCGRCARRRSERYAAFDRALRKPANGETRDEKFDA